MTFAESMSRPIPTEHQGDFGVLGTAVGSITGPGIQGLQDAKTREEATRVLWERFYENLCRAAYRQLRAMHADLRVADQDDVAERAFTKICASIMQGKLRPPSRLDLQRLFRLATRQEVLNHLARMRKDHGLYQGRADEQFLVDPADGPVSFLLANEAFAVLIDALQDQDLQRIALWKVLGHTHPEIAERMDCTTSTVERKIRHMRDKLDPGSRAHPGARGSSTPTMPVDEITDIATLLDIILDKSRRAPIGTSDFSIENGGSSR